MSNTNVKRKKSFLSKYYKRAKVEENSSDHVVGTSVDADDIYPSVKPKTKSSELNVSAVQEEPNRFSLPTSINISAEAVEDVLDDVNLSSISSDENSQFQSDIQSHQVDLEAHNEISDTIPRQLAKWALKYNISHSAVTDLLHVLKPVVPDLPMSSRTLLQTPRSLILKSVEPGEYFHFGFQKCLEKLLRMMPSNSLSNSKSLEVCINVDGLPLSKSSGSQLYPILCNLFQNKNIVGVIGIYHGNEKPKDANCFLRLFVDEVVSSMQTGFEYNGSLYSIKVKAFICDVPAKSFIKYCRGHSGYMSCSKCEVEGVFIQNRVCFTETKNLSLRTDENFRMQSQESHHTGKSILELLPGVDMIRDFPLDYMHLLCLGVVKKMIVNLWLNGKPSENISFKQMKDISDVLSNQVPEIPSEFNRKPRSLIESKRWKAVEFRLFLFYTGPIALKNNISSDKYKHFLSLHVAMSLLSRCKCPEDIDYAGTLLQYFVEAFIILYGSHNVSHNVHNLLHVCDDVKYYGSINNYSAFPFENYMQYFKKFVRKGDKPLQQIVKRINEQDSILINSVTSTRTLPELSLEHMDGPLLSNTRVDKQFGKISLENFMLTSSQPNNCCAIDANVIVIKNIVTVDDKIFLIGRKFLNVEDFYEIPCNSSDLGIYLVSHLGPLQSWPFDKMLRKYMKLNYCEKFVVLPLLHIE